MKYPYFRGLEADRYSFYRVPKALIKVFHITTNQSMEEKHYE